VLILILLIKRDRIKTSDEYVLIQIKCLIFVAMKGSRLFIIYVKKLNIIHYVLRTMTTKTTNIKSVVLQSWHIFTRTRTIAMFYLKCKIIRSCDLCDRNPLKGFKINSR